MKTQTEPVIIKTHLQQQLTIVDTPATSTVFSWAIRESWQFIAGKCHATEIYKPVAAAAEQMNEYNVIHEYIH